MEVIDDAALGEARGAYAQADQRVFSGGSWQRCDVSRVIQRYLGHCEEPAGGGGAASVAVDGSVRRIVGGGWCRVEGSEGEGRGSGGEERLRERQHVRSGLEWQERAAMIHSADTEIFRPSQGKELVPCNKSVFAQLGMFAWRRH